MNQLIANIIANAANKVRVQTVLVTVNQEDGKEKRTFSYILSRDENKPRVWIKRCGDCVTASETTTEEEVIELVNKYGCRAVAHETIAVDIAVEEL